MSHCVFTKHNVTASRSRVSQALKFVMQGIVEKSNAFINKKGEKVVMSRHYGMGH